jgi:hypothetical protein
MLKRRTNKKKLICPRCGQTFQRAQALGGHIAYKHADKLASKPAQLIKRKKKSEARVTVPPPIPETDRVAEPVLESVPVVAAVESSAVPALVVTAASAAANAGAHEHLKSALAELIARQRQIDEDLARMQTLQVEKEAIGKQINAVNSALQAFAS